MNTVMQRGWAKACGDMVRHRVNFAKNHAGLIETMSLERQIGDYQTEKGKKGNIC